MNNVLDVSKFKAGKLELDLRPTDIRTLINRVGQINKASVLRKELTLSVSISPYLPLLLSLDEVRLSQVLMNLISNAIKFTEKGEVSIKVRWVPDKASIPQEKRNSYPQHDYATKSEPLNEYVVASSEKEVSDDFSLDFIELANSDPVEPSDWSIKSTGLSQGFSIIPQSPEIPALLCSYSYEKKGVLEISVSDTGRGISAEMLPQLFKPFSQDKASKFVGGTGLGLYISKTILTALGADLTVGSVEGAGTIFTISLPCNVETWVSSTSGFSAFQEPTSYFSVLLLDKSRRWLTQNSEVLKKLGLSVITASEPRDALSLIQKTAPSSFNCMIISCSAYVQQLPAIIRNIRSREELTNSKRMPIYFLGSAVKKERILSAPIDCDGWLNQPLASKQVSQIVSALKQKENRQQFSQPNTALLIDDDSFTSDIVMSFIEKAKWECIHAASGTQALEVYKAKSSQISLVLCDCLLPDISGYEVSNAIRSFEKAANQPEVPIIAISGQSGEAHEEACRKAGMTLICKAYSVQKPFSYDVFKKTLASYSDGTGSKT